MLQLAPTTAFELAHASGVPRISTYPVLRGLIDKQLADRLPGDGPAVYGGVDRDTLLSRLDALKHERLRGHCQHSQHLRRRLDQAIPHQSSAAGPPLRLLATAAQQHDTFQRLAQQAHSEALIAAVPEEDGDALEPGLGELANPAETRVLYQAGQGGGASPAIAATHACHDAGAHARTVERLSVEVAIFDRTTALVTLERPVDGQPATLVWLDHPGVAAALADAFTDTGPRRPTGR
jgi:hypothetical protein